MGRQTKFLKNLQRFRLITFDVTDTLLKFKKPVAETYAQKAQDAGLKNIDIDQLSTYFRKHIKEMMKRHPNFGYNTPNMSWQEWWIQTVESTFRCVAPTASPELIHRIAKQLLIEYRTKACWDHIEGGQMMIHKLRDINKYVGVISNFDPGLHNVLHEMNLDHKFDLILSSYDVGAEKPSAKIFTIPLQHFNLNAEQALHVGNTYELDYLGARNSGWSSLLIASNSVPDEHAQRMHVFPSITAMMDALETRDIQW